MMAVRTQQLQVFEVLGDGSQDSAAATLLQRFAMHATRCGGFLSRQHTTGWDTLQHVLT